MASISAPERVLAGESVAFTGHGRQPGGSIDSYDWTFGDGGRATGAAVSHDYVHAGSYQVVLQLTDSARNWVFATRAVRVRPAPEHASPARRR